jgi:hypothetical protein
MTDCLNLPQRRIEPEPPSLSGSGSSSGDASLLMLVPARPATDNRRRPALGATALRSQPLQKELRDKVAASHVSDRDHKPKPEAPVPLLWFNQLKYLKTMALSTTIIHDWLLLRLFRLLQAGSAFPAMIPLLSRRI